MNRSMIVSVAVLTGIAASVLVATPALAVAGLTLVSATSAETGSEDFKGVNAVCPAGTKIVGGGADIVGGSRNVQLAGINPAALGFPADSIWATANEKSGGYSGSWHLIAWAVCASGVTGHEIVQTMSAAAAGSTFTSATATCPGAKKVIGAGGLSAGKAPYVLDSINIASNLRSVTVETLGDETTPHPSTAPLAGAYAICVNPVPAMQRVVATQVNSFDKTVSVNCPAGTRLHGLGGGLFLADGEAYLDRLAPRSTLTGADINAREDATGNALRWSASIHGVCAA